jgi:hypothetical protein
MQGSFALGKPASAGVLYGRAGDNAAIGLFGYGFKHGNDPATFCLQLDQHPHLHNPKTSLSLGNDG